MCVENNLCKRYDNTSLNNTNNVSKHINQYITDVVNNYKSQQSFKSKRTTYYILIDDAVINKHNTVYTNDNRNVVENK